MKSPETTVQSGVAAIMYPDLDAMTDSLYLHAFSGEHVSGGELKFGDASNVVAGLERREIAERGEPMDRKVRTHNYLEEVKEMALDAFWDLDQLYLDLHTLPASAEYTPYNYSDIVINKYPQDVPGGAGRWSNERPIRG